MTTTTFYQDRWITCTEDGVRIRGYYFPWGTKTIPYTAIRSVRRVEMGMLTGQGRIWGTGHPRYWASLDPGRMSKSTALILDLGRFVRPFLTPDDPDAMAAVLRARMPPGAGEGDDDRR
ncbi:hypothetical protein [Streptomyces sp. NPDC093707]|uniref:hypothetical protein n=1 Tax=Streptomyces sp. NPDC093707 TaxID=3154984 RepID=UPI00344C6E14